MSTNTIKSRDVISCRQAEAYVTIGDQRIHAMNLINFTATVEKDKVEVHMLGNIMKKHKSVGAAGTFTAKVHFMSSTFQRMVEEFKDTGVDAYFTIQGTVNDKTSAAGEYTAIFYECNLDGIDIMSFDAEGDTIQQDVEGTFDDFKIVRDPNALPNVI